MLVFFLRNKLLINIKHIASILIQIQDCHTYIHRERQKQVTMKPNLNLNYVPFLLSLTPNHNCNPNLFLRQCVRETFDFCQCDKEFNILR